MNFPWSFRKHNFYSLYFKLVRRFIDLTTRYNCRPLGLAIGTVFLELSSAVNAVGRRLYYKNPHHHGFNSFSHYHKGKSPVILIHGRLGRWSDLMDLALSLQCANIPVFLIKLENSSVPLESERRQINVEIIRIQTLYGAEFNEDCPRIDIVGHSLGGHLALYAAFTRQCSFIEDGTLKFTGNPESNPSVGKVITLGMPTNACEIKWIWAAGKKCDIFNIVAKFDAIIGTKECALLPSQVMEVDAGHLGLLTMVTYLQVMRWLRMS